MNGKTYIYIAVTWGMLYELMRTFSSNRLQYSLKFFSPILLQAMSWMTVQTNKH